MQPTGDILMLYDDGSTHVGTIYEHLKSFQKYSRHKFHYMPATLFLPLIDDEEDSLDLSAFSAVAIHYSVRLSVSHHLSKGIARSLSLYDGPKLLFIQDEYEHTELARQWIEQLGVNAIFTNVPTASIERVYPSSRLQNIDFIPTLTGYVPEETALDAFALPLEERKILIGYRGRRLPYHYGDLGQEKYKIGVDVKRLAESAQLPVDIEVDDSHRIYGDDWYRFLGSCRATLGTESGANIFDFDGTLAKHSADHSDMPYDRFREKFLEDREGEIQMNQISPKIFEAIRLRTALVLFEGDYSGVVKPDLHYIPLSKDYSNIEDVFAKLRDLQYVNDLTLRAYEEVIQSQRYSYKAFIACVDDYIDRCLRKNVKTRIVSVPNLAISEKDSKPSHIMGSHSGRLLISNIILGRELTRSDYIETVQTSDVQTLRKEKRELRARLNESSSLLAEHQRQSQIQIDSLLEAVQTLEAQLTVRQQQSHAQIASLMETIQTLEAEREACHRALNAANIAPSLRNISWLTLRRIWLFIPEFVRASIVQHHRSIPGEESPEGAGKSVPLWLRLLPSRVRKRLRSHMRTGPVQ